MCNRPQILIVLAIALIGIASRPSAAQERHSGFYISGAGAATFFQDVEVEELVDVNLKTGFGAFGGLGYDFGYFRAEGEFGYRKNNIDSLSGFGLTVDASGDATVTSGMANLYYDFAMQDPKWSPYIGGGIGYARVSVNDVEVAGVPVLDDDDSALAGQAMVGLAYAISDSVEIFGGYRFFLTDSLKLRDTSSSENDVKGLRIHQAEAGVRFRF